MLITTCGHCGARFRVTPQQLNAKQGQVRCGSCQGVFNGFESLERLPDDDTGSRLLAAREAAERAIRAEQPPAPPPEPAAPARVQRLLRPDLSLPAPPRPKPPARAWRFGVALVVVVL